ncbi:hypothetical protein [Cryobacterium algoritolerans]|uniref:hypothetical protein n=1 Tax=Cryobacterium algoritolerans TaxID=1259184 RepID=UPI0010692928|nr:hypothetical protein [Cryobacterium algoritolerans]
MGEYDWANSRVFGRMIPPRDRLELVDTIGAGKRETTLPRFDNRITVNMGDDAFADRRQCEVASGRKV